MTHTIIYEVDLIERMGLYYVSVAIAGGRPREFGPAHSRSAAEDLLAVIAKATRHAITDFCASNGWPVTSDRQSVVEAPAS